MQKNGSKIRKLRYCELTTITFKMAKNNDLQTCHHRVGVNLLMLARLINWCFENPRLFWTIVIVGGIADLMFFYLLLSGQ